MKKVPSERYSMSDFQELIKNFERIRDYMRQFFLYGFKVRSEFGEKSGRTYDNERRRIESYLNGYIHADYTSRGKQVSVHMDSKQISSNPLYAAWKSKSFTDNDLLLHFFWETGSLSPFRPSAISWPNAWRRCRIFRPCEISAGNMNALES